MLASPSAARSQSAETRRLAYLLNFAKPKPDPKGRPGSWRARLASLGWTQDKNLVIERFYSGGPEQTERLPSLVSEIVKTGADAIYVLGTSTAVAAARGTTQIPIVLGGASAYPVECGLIDSYARPGRNVTGVAWFQGIEVHSKLAQFVREILPSARRLAWVVFPDDLVTVAGGEFSPRKYYARTAQSLGFDFHYEECRKLDRLDSTFEAIRRWRADAVIVEPANQSWWAAGRIAELATRHRLPSLCGMTENVLRGALLAYSPLIDELQLEAFAYVDRIFRGARTAELPVAMPNKLELSVNLRTARTLGITIPRSILVSADRVIQ